MEAWEGLGREQVRVVSVHQCTDADVRSSDGVSVLVML